MQNYFSNILPNLSGRNEQQQTATNTTDAQRFAFINSSNTSIQRRPSSDSVEQMRQATPPSNTAGRKHANAVCLLNIGEKTYSLNYQGSEYETEESKQVLAQLLEETLASKSLDLSVPAQRMQIFTLRQKISQLQSQYKLTHNQSDQQDKISLDQDGDPVVFSLIRQCAEEGVQSLREQRDRTIVLEQRPLLDPQSLNVDKEGWSELLKQCKQEKNLIETLERNFNFLIDLAQCEDNPHAVSITRNPFGVITLGASSDPVLGFSIYQLLAQADVLPKGQYSGRTEFFLTMPQLDKLNSYLNDVKKWFTDFENILLEFIGDNVPLNDHLQLGQTSVFEWLQTGDETNQWLTSIGKKSVDRTFSSGYFNRQAEQKNRRILFINDLSVNLKNHPHADAIKNIFENTYLQKGLFSNSSGRKTFLKTEQYRTNLDRETIQKINPVLNKWIAAKRIYDNFLGHDDAFYSEISKANSDEILSNFRSFKVNMLLDFCRLLTPGHLPSTVGIAYELNQCRNFDDIDDMVKHFANQYLDNHSSACLSPSNELPALTQGQIDSLYNFRNPRMVSIRRSPQIEIMNVEHLFNRLQSCSGYKNLISQKPEYQSAVDNFKRQIALKVEQYPELSEGSFYYGRPRVREGLEYLERFVATMVNAEALQISSESIEHAFIEMQGQSSTDMERGCAMGFQGRILSVLLSLTSTPGNDLDGHLFQFRKDCASQAFNDLYGSSFESSMAVNLREALESKVGISRSGNVSQIRHVDTWALNRLEQNFNRLYNPKTIFNRAREFFRDKFWEINQEPTRHKEMYDFLRCFGFKGSDAELDMRFRVLRTPEHPFQYTFVAQEMMPKILSTLIDKDLIRSTANN